MKLSFCVKVPWLDRLDILLKGGLHVSIEYRGQHQIMNAKCEAMRVTKVSTEIKKEK